MAGCHSFCLFFIFSSIHTFIQSLSYNTFAKASLHILITGKLSGKTSLWCRAENQTRACLPASRHALPSEPRRTINMVQLGSDGAVRNKDGFINIFFLQVGHLALSLNSAGNLLIYLLAGYLNTAL